MDWESLRLEARDENTHEWLERGVIGYSSHDGHPFVETTHILRREREPVLFVDANALEDASFTSQQSSDWNVQLVPRLTSQTTAPLRADSDILKHPIPWAKQKTQCHVCGEKLLKKTLKRHIRDKHSIPGSYIKCSVCQKAFKRGDILERHISEQHGEASGIAGTVQCMHCGYSIRQRALEEHMKSRKCVEARDALLVERTTSYDLEMYALDVSSELSGRFGLSSVIEPEMACDLALAIRWIYRSNGVLHYQENSPEFWAFRGLAISALRRQFLTDRDEVPWGVLGLYCVDRLVFGEASQTALAHRRYLEHWPRSNRLFCWSKKTALHIIKRRSGS